MSDGPLTRIDDGPLAVVTMDGPPLNLFDREMIEAWTAMAQALAADPPRGLLIRAAGKVVSGGVDVHLFQGLDAAAASAFLDELLAITRVIERLPCPTVFAAHGLTLTAAFELSLGCDILLASRSARFGLVEATVGLTPSMGGTQRLVERAGTMRARELVMTGELFDAETLERWDVVTRVLDDDGFDDAARAFAGRLAAGPTRAHAVTKDVVRAQVEGGTDAADAMVTGAVGALYETDDLRSAVESFVTQGPGKARFTGD